MKTFEDLRNEMSSRHFSLSPRLKQLTRFAIGHPNEMALETISEIARQAQAPPSSLIRLAKTFGFSGFSEMQKVFRQGLVESMSDYRERVRVLDQRLLEEGGNPGQSNLELFIEGGIEALNHLRHSVKEKQVEEAAGMLAAARIVHIAAQRRSFPVAAYLAYAFSHLGKPYVLMDSVGGMLAEQGKSMDSGDALVAVSFPPYSAEVLKLVADAQDRKIPVLAITDNLLSPLVSYSSMHMEVGETEVLSFRGLSLTALMCLSLCLVVELGLQMKS